MGIRIFKKKVFLPLLSFMIFLSCHQESSVFTTSLGVIPTFSIYGYSYFMLSRKLSSYFIAKILTVKLREGHMPRTSTFTLEKLAIKIECNFENYMVRGTFGRENRNSEIPNSVLRIVKQKVGRFWYIQSLVFQNMP